MEKVIGNIQGREIILETGEMARQANGAVVLRCGETVLLAKFSSTSCLRPPNCVAATGSATRKFHGMLIVVA